MGGRHRSALAPALLALQLGAGDGQTPCVDPTTGKSLQELVTAEGSGLATPYGQMVINPCVPMTSAPNPACPASALCCINLNSSSWTSCGSAPTWLRFGEFEARAQTGQRITGGGICAQIPLKFFETTITFECDEGAVGAGRVVPQAMPPGFVWDTCMMNVTWYTRLVCGEAVNPPAPSPGAPGEAAGWGWPFLLVIGLGSGLYCGAGAFYNSRKYMLPVRLPPLFSSAPLVSTLLPQFPCRSPADPAAVAARSSLTTFRSTSSGRRCRRCAAMAWRSRSPSCRRSWAAGRLTSTSPRPAGKRRRRSMLSDSCCCVHC